jgi:hypothetical protein
MNPSSLESTSLAFPVLSISRCDRWQAHQRLLELGIPCQCEAEGFLRVEVNSPLALVQLQSVVQQFTASRQDLLGWLEACWQALH